MSDENRPNSPPLAPWIAGSLAALVALAWWSHASRDDPLFFFVDVADAGRPGEGAITVVSGLLIAIAGGVHLFLGRLEFLERRRGWHWWIVAGTGLLVLALDEIVMIHEWITFKLDGLNIPQVFGTDRDIYIFAIYGALAVIVAARLLPAWRRHPVVWRPLLAVVALAAGSQILDAIPWQQVSDAQRRLIGPLEEILKTIASLCAVLYSFALLEDVVSDRRRRPAETPGGGDAP